ncbi:MAG TPA: glycosyltransferase [Thermoanaerobaculia bacterium]
MFLTRSLAVGGAERQLAALARGLSAAGHEVSVASLYDEVPLGAGLDDAGVNVHVIGKRSRWDVLSFVRRLVAFVRAWKPDVIHSYLPVPNLIAAVMRPFFRRAPIVWGIRSSDVDLTRFDWLTRATYGIEPLFSKIPALIIMNSSAGREHAIRHGYRPDRIVVIPNGVDTNRFRYDEAGRTRVREEWNVRPDEDLVGLVARIDPLKDHATFIAAAAGVARRVPSTRFVCVGNGPPAEKENLKAQAAALGIGDRVRFHDARTDVAAVYSALDVLCSSSTTEGFPNVIAEAMSCGTPCVVTDAGDSAEIVGDRGIVVPRRDWEAMADGVVDLLERKPFSRASCRERIEARFSLEALVRRTADAIESRIAKR